MNICLISNNNYVDYVSSLIVSILKNSSLNDKFHFHIIEIDITDYNKDKLKELKNIKDFEISFYRPEKYINKAKELSNREHNKYWHYTIFIKLFIPLILKDLDNVLFLDSDQIVLSSLSKFYEYNISNSYLLVVRLFGHNISWIGNNIESIMNKFGANKNDYINGGILLFNIKHLYNNIKYDELSKNIDDAIDYFEKIGIGWTEELVFLYLFTKKISYIDCNVVYGTDINNNSPKLSKSIELLESNNKDEINIIHFSAKNIKPLSNYKNIDIYYNIFWEYFILTPFFKENTIKYINIYSNNISKYNIIKLKSNFIKIIDKIVWYIPIKKIRNSIRDSLTKKIFE
ncbi:glycosyltransferase [Brachyspira sp. SAP_772]|uniref:glycosyltransferase family 8 protein n=1 Tax=Brachyspira sp. SAP_772 TaxID=2608385 RepID=UPI0012F4AE62|nr:glycosyltransferase [Brachyspira sp. SAP_772]